MSSEFKDLNEIERQTERGQEGQDTITPLTNASFLRQLSKLKHQVGAQLTSNGSSKSINSIDSNRSPLDTSFPFDQDGESVTSLNVLNKKPATTNRVPENLLSLFSKDGPSTMSNSEFVRSISASAKHLNTLENRASNVVAEKLVDALTSMVSFNQELVYVGGKAASRSATLNNRHTGVTDEFFLDDEFINNVRLIVQHNELIKKHKLSKSIFACRIFITIFLVIMLLMIGYFLKTVYSISESFKAIENFNHFGYARNVINANVTKKTL